MNFPGKSIAGSNREGILHFLHRPPTVIVPLIQPANPLTAGRGVEHVPAHGNQGLWIADVGAAVGPDSGRRLSGEACRVDQGARAQGRPDRVAVARSVVDPLAP